VSHRFFGIAEWRLALSAATLILIAVFSRLVPVAVVFACLLSAQPPESHELVEARRLLAEHRWAPAIGAFEKLLKQNPKSVDAHIGLGIALWASGDKQRALIEFQSALQVNPGSPQAHYNVALALRDLGEHAKAIAELNRALKLKPDYDDARLALGLVQQQTGDLSGAMAQYRLVLKRNPRSAEAHNWLGVAYMQKNQLAEAAEEFRHALKLKPDYARAYNNLGSTLAQAGDVKAGIEAFQAGLQYAPADIQLHLNLGTALRTSGDADGAVHEFETVLASSPGDPEVHYQLGHTLRQKGDIQGAIREFETTLDLNPEYRETYYILGQTLRQWAAKVHKPAAAHVNADAAVELKAGTEALARGDVTAAVAAFRRGCAKDPGSAEAFNALGLALGRARDLQGAVENLRKATALEPELAEARFNLGAALWYAGDKGGSAKELDEAIRLNPASVEAYGLRGLAYRDAGDLGNAKRVFQRSIALSPAQQVGYFDLAAVFLRLNEVGHAIGQFEAGLNLPAPAGPPPDLDLAIRELRRTISAKPTAEAHDVLGRLLGLAGASVKDTAAEFEAAIRMRPEFAEAHNNLGLVYTQAGDDEKAIGAFREAIRQRPDYADAHANLGAILTATDIGESVRELERALALQPTLLKAQYNLALAYDVSPSHGVDKAIELLRKLIAVDANYPRAELALGKALLRKGAVQEAVDHLRRAISAEPGSGEAHYQLGLALTRSGMKEEAAAELKKGRELIASAQAEQTLVADMDEGRAALERGDVDNALLKFEQVRKQRPDLAQAHLQVGLAMERKGDSAAAAVAYRKALELNPSMTEAKQALLRVERGKFGDDPEQVALFEAHVRNGNFKELEPLVIAYLDQHPNSAWGWYTLGYSYFAEQNISKAISALSKSLSVNVANADAHKVLGRCLMMIGRFDAAQVEFEQGAKYDPRSAEMPYNLGKLFSIQDQWPAARQAFESALRLDPTYMEAYDGLGFAMEALGEDDEAIRNYRKAAELNAARKGNFAAPYVNLAAFYNKSGNVDAALENGQKAVEINPKSDRGWFQMGKAYERRGDMERAADALTRAIALNGRVSAYHYVLATVYRRLGKQGESKQAMDAFSKLEQESNEIEQKRIEGKRQEGSLRD
jgi:tetratricopeptide (TPR) repeat protein